MTREVAGSRNGADVPSLAALDAAPFAVIGTALDGRIFYVNAAAEQLYGRSGDGSRDASVFEMFVRPVDRQAARDIIATVVSGQVWSGEFTVPHADGSSVQIHIDDFPLWHEGRLVGILGVSRPVDDPEISASVHVLANVGQITAELAGAKDASTVAHLVIDRAADAFGADLASMSLLEPDGRLRLTAERGVAPEARERFAVYEVDESSPVGYAVKHCQIVTISGTASFRDRFPGMPLMGEQRSLVAAPLLIGERCVGGISLSFDGLRTFGPTDSVFLRILADTTAQAIGRLNAAAVAESRARKLAILAEASEELASSLDYQTTLGNVAQLALDQLADWVGIELLEDENLRPVVTLHRDPEMVELAAELRRRYPQPLDSPTGVPAVIRSGTAQLYEHISEQALEQGARDPEHLLLIRRLGLASMMIVPLIARDRPLGALVLVSSDRSRRYNAEDLAFAEDLARRAAVAIDNSHLYSQTLESSVRLQHALLPESVPEPATWDVSVHYRPAGRTEVGGDFYDAIQLDDNRLVTVVGDVMGRGISAAAAMAQLRASLRAYIAIDPDPAVVLTKLTEMFAFYRMGGLATVLVALADATECTVTMASAGHLPPLLVRPGEEPTLATPPSSPPLGVGSYDRAATTVRLRPGDTIVLYTDGLVETRDQDIDAGIGRLIAAIRGGRPVDSDGALRALAADLVQSDQDDDVTVLSLRCLGGGSPPVKD